MKQSDIPPDCSENSMAELTSQYETNLEYQREVLKHITEIGGSLRLPMDTDTLLKRVSIAVCQALRFRHSALYLSDGAGYFRVHATSGINTEEEEYLLQHSLPEAVVAQLISESYRISDSYFIPAEAPLWENESIASFFIIVDDDNAEPTPIPSSSPISENHWRPEDLMVVPLVSGDNTLLGFLTPDAPLNGLRPTAETMALLELFANQAAVVIEGSRLYTELREALKLAQESERLKNHFLMTASHELRTPLTAIQGYLELLSTFGSVLDEDAKTRFINNARRACEELILLLGNVMDTGHVDQDQVTLKLGPVQVIQAIRVILEILEPTITHERRTVELRAPDELYAWADDLRLRQILLNLVGNVLKYTPVPSGVAITAERIDADALCQRLPSTNFQLPTSGLFVLVAIRDWGPGIALADQPLLFTKFIRLESSINSKQRGAGLGLYLCRQLTEAMGGYIWLESKGIPGEGSTFFVALPEYQR